MFSFIDYTKKTTIKIKCYKTKSSKTAKKTENGVYEHTKFICDRLLGAELLSVSTIELVEADEADGSS